MKLYLQDADNKDAARAMQAIEVKGKNMNNDKVIKSFLERKAANTMNLHSDGVVLKSYEMVIAQWFTDGTLRIHLSHCPSKTTTTHRNGLIRKCETTHPNTYKPLPNGEEETR